MVLSGKGKTKPVFLLKLLRKVMFLIKLIFYILICTGKFSVRSLDLTIRSAFIFTLILWYCEKAEK